VDLRVADLKEMDNPGETPAQKAFRGAVLDGLVARFKSLLNDGGTLALSLDLGRKATDLSLALSLSAKPDSGLAADIAGLGKARSGGASLVGPDSALNGQAHLALPEKMRTALAPVIDEGVKKALEGEKDRGKRELLSGLLQALAPTLKGAELDAGFDL